MNGKKIVGSVALILGAGMYLMSSYISEQVSEGQGQINSAQKKVDTGNKIFSQSGYTKGIGKAVTGSVQKQIDEGQTEVDKYSQIASGLHVGGILVFIVGIGLLAYSFSRKKT